MRRGETAKDVRAKQRDCWECDNIRRPCTCSPSRHRGARRAARWLAEQEADEYVSLPYYPFLGPTDEP